jgi:malate dehydrogenase (oxaloacetate-decarboxylating)
MMQATADRIIETALSGTTLLEAPLYNKGTGFSAEERRELGLLGLLPPHIDDMKTQLMRAYDAYQRKDDDLERHIFLRSLQDRNEVLFYSLVVDHLPEMLPMIYTPVVGTACQQFSEIYRHSRGLFISYPERENIDAILGNAPVPNVEAIVVTDGERILGLGDQGAGGMGIPIGKLSLYTACGGISPDKTLPILLDVGTNNQDRLNDPMYIGWRQERVTGQEYDDFLDLFVQGVKRAFPRVLLQFEDFAQTHASPLLERYRDQLCTFNDDIQGTAAVAVGTLLSAVKVAGARMSDQVVTMFGAGSAGCGIAEQIVAAMVKQGLNEKEARSRFFMIDRPGLLHDGIQNLLPFQQKLLQPKDKVAGWASAESGEISLLDVIKHAHPTILIGVSGQPDRFTEDAIREMAKHAERPIIFPLSNPTSRVEAIPADLIEWTDGRALIATGSPFDPVKHEGRTYPIAQCNNSYIFPAMGLGILGIGARRVSDSMFMVAAEALSENAPALKSAEGSLLPSLDQVREVSRRIAYAVAAQAQHEGLADACSAQEMRDRVDAKHWEPKYSVLKRKRT